MSEKYCFDPSEYIVYQPYPGLHVVYHVKRWIYSGQSRLQRIDIIENEAYGRMLLLNGNLQHTEFDAHIFNRALVGPILRSRLGEVLVFGGGSGQTVATLLRGGAVRRVVVVEIDPEIVEACSAHIAGVAEAFNDHRVKLVFEDCWDFMKSCKDRFDALVVDLTEEWLGRGVDLGDLYRFVAERCSGRCSCYIGPSSRQTGGPERARRHLESASRYLRRVRIRRVFIPSFGSEQLFLYGGL